MFVQDVKQHTVFDKTTTQGGYDYEFQEGGSNRSEVDRRGKPLISGFEDTISDQRGPAGEQDVRDLLPKVNDIKGQYIREKFGEDYPVSAGEEFFGDAGNYFFSACQRGNVSDQSDREAAHRLPYGMRNFESEAD